MSIPFLFGKSFEATFPVKKALQSFSGIGPAVSRQMMARMTIHETAQLRDLDTEKIQAINGIMTGMRIDGDLAKYQQDNIGKLYQIGCYRGKRHGMGLPVRGQCTRTQIKTARRLNRLERKF